MSKPNSGLFPVNKLDNNIHYVTKEYKLHTNGYFGSKGTREWIREIYSSNPILEAGNFFDKISEGGKSITLSKFKGVAVEMPDGTKITMRIKTSSKDSPAVEINVKGFHPQLKQYQKIHFVKK